MALLKLHGVILPTLGISEAKPGRSIGQPDLGAKHHSWDEMMMQFGDEIPAFGIKLPTWSPLN